MAAFRSCFWIQILRKLTKSVIQNCYGCKRFRSTHYPNPRRGLLPKDRTEQALPFEIMGTDYVGSLCKKDLKAYILLFSCSISRAVDMELMSNLTATEFIKRFLKFLEGESQTSYIQIT